MIDSKLGPFFINFHQVMYGYSKDKLRRFLFNVICKRTVRINKLSQIKWS